MLKHKIRVLIVEDSDVYSRYLQNVLDADGMLSVAGTPGTGKEALEMTEALRPDVITLDLSLPDVSRFELLEKLVRQYRMPVIVVTSLPQACEEALRLGAKDYIEKRQANDERTAEQFELLLRLKIKTQAGERKARSSRLSVSSPNDLGLSKAGKVALIAVGASLGGTEVVMRMLSRLPRGLPGIVIVQHMPTGFTNAYAMRLNQYSELAVHEAVDNDLILPGTALVAPGGRQLSVIRSGSGYRVRLGGGEKNGGFCPSVDTLFTSVAAAAGPNAMGIILTGMGRDGALGLKAMHDAGAFTLAQDKESCAIFGMPAAAVELGGVDATASPEEMVERLLKLSKQ